MNKRLSTVVIIAVLLVTLTYFSNVLFPLLFAVVASFTLTSFVERLERWNFPTWLSVLISMAIPLIVIVGLGFTYYYTFSYIVSDLPDISTQADKALDKAEQSVEQTFDFSLPNVEMPSLEDLRKRSKSLLSSGTSILSETFSAFSGVVSFLVLIPVYMFFMLTSRKNINTFLEKRYPPYRAKRNKVLLRHCAKTLSSYYRSLTLIILIVAVLNTVGLYIIGIPYAIALGTFSALLIVIPYVGVAVGGAIPVLIAIITQDTLQPALFVVLLYALVQFLEGNVITPNIVGKQIDLNPLFLVLALIFGGVIGGLLGVVLAVPMIALIHVFLSYIPKYRSWGYLLSNETQEK